MPQCRCGTRLATQLCTWQAARIDWLAALRKRRQGSADEMITRTHTTQRILATYLAIYAAAITVGVAATHNLVLAAVHGILLIVGAVVLRMILPALTGDRL
ncbi:MAG: hypothetical protein NVSMB65_02640 [Chloroflexota bacterium]